MGVRFVPLCALLGVSACVQPFSGSDVQIDFTHSTQRPLLPGEMAAAGSVQPPQDTYYSLWAEKQTRDGTGAVVKDYLFEVRRFEIKKLIDTSSPCFIDLDGTRYPGIHVTEFANRLLQDLGIKDPLNPPDGTPPGDETDALDATIRMSQLPDLEQKVLVVTDTSNAKYGPSETACIEDNAGVDQTKFPPPKCIGDQSNALRLKLCKAFFAANPEFYEGSDKVFTVPINGKFRGMVEGQNPRNGSFIGGSEFLVDTALLADAYQVYWQYKDLNNDGMPDTPPGSMDTDFEKKVGHVYMAGVPTHDARGVTNVTLVNPSDATIGGEMAIFPDLANDGTHF